MAAMMYWLEIWMIGIAYSGSALLLIAIAFDRKWG